MENPFSTVNSPSLRPSSLNEGGLVKEPSEPSLVKGGQGELTLKGQNGVVEFETRRSELKPEVRQYADRLHSSIKDFYAAYGSKNAADLYDKAKSGAVFVPKEDAKKLLRLQTELESALTRNELPPSHRELPPLEVFREAVDRINRSAYPNQVMQFDRWEDYELIDGKLNGRMFVGDRGLPIINGELIKIIDGQNIGSCSDVRNVDGKLNGRVVIGGKSLPVMAGKIIKEFKGMEILGCDYVHIVDGQLNGLFVIENRRVAIINGELIDNIGDNVFKDLFDVRSVDGKLNGVFKFGDSWLPVIDGKIIKEIDGQEIQMCDHAFNVDGKLNGEVYIVGRWLPVIAGEIIESIDGKKIEAGRNVSNIDGKLNGEVYIVGRWLPVIAGKIIEEIDGRTINQCTDTRNIDGKLNGIVIIGVCYSPVIAGELVKNIGGSPFVGRIMGIKDYSDAGGVFSGELELVHWDGRRELRRVVLGEFVY